MSAETASIQQRVRELGPWFHDLDLGAWGGRAVVAWTERFARDPSFDPEVGDPVTVARVLVRIYGRGA